MFAHRRNIRANPTEGRGSGHRPETTGNLLLDFHHAQIAFGQVVIERDAEVRHKAQDFRLALLQAQEQVACFALFAAAALPGHGLGGRVVPQACFQQGLIAGEVGFVRGGVQAFRPSRPRLFDRAFDLAQEGLEFLRPGLVALLDQRGQFAQMMGIAQGVLTVRLPIRDPGIVDGDPVKLGQNANRGGRCGAAFGVRGIVRQVRCARDVQPLPLPRDRQPGLIKLRDRRRLHTRFDRSFHLRQGRRAGLLGGAERAGREAMAKQIGKQFAGARLRQQLIGAQIDRHGLRARPVLHHVGDIRWERCLGARLTMTTDFVFAAMFGDAPGQDGQFKDLSSFIVRGALSRQILATARAVGDRVRLDLIGVCTQSQPRAAMPRLPADGALTLRAQACGGFLEAVLRGRLRAVARVALDLSFQFGDARRQIINALEQPLDQGDHRLGTGVIHRLDFVTCHRS